MIKWNDKKLVKIIFSCYIAGLNIVYVTYCFIGIYIVRFLHTDWDTQVVRLEDNRNIFKILIENLISERWIRILGHRWLGNIIKMDIAKLRLENTNWIQFARIGISGEVSSMRHWITDCIVSHRITVVNYAVCNLNGKVGGHVNI